MSAFDQPFPNPTSSSSPNPSPSTSRRRITVASPLSYGSTSPQTALYQRRLRASQQQQHLLSSQSTQIPSPAASSTLPSLKQSSSTVSLHFEVVPPTPTATDTSAAAIMSSGDGGGDSLPPVRGGPRFILPDTCKDPSQRMRERIQHAMESGGGAYLQVPINPTRRRHSWICG